MERRCESISNIIDINEQTKGKENNKICLWCDHYLIKALKKQIDYEIFYFLLNLIQLAIYYKKILMKIKISKERSIW